MICINCRYGNDEAQSDEIQKEDIAADEETDDVLGISYHPNPVLETLYIKWQNTETVSVNGIAVYSTTGALINSVAGLNQQGETTLNFDTVADGMYSLVVTYNNGEKIYITILKKR